MSSGSKPVTTIGTRYAPPGVILPVAHHGADVPGQQEALHVHLWRV